MFRKEVSGRVITVATILILATVQLAYWRLLVYREKGGPPMGGGGGGGGGGPEPVLGLEDVDVQTLAGGVPGYLDGAGWQAEFCGPNALAVEADGSVLVADSRNHRLRRISKTGKVSTVAGSGPAGGNGGKAEGPAAGARFSFPSGVAVGADGAIYISDTGNHRVCRLQNGQVSVLASAGLKEPATLSLGADGALWVLDAADLKVRRIESTGSVGTPENVPEEVRLALGETSVKPKPETLTAWGQYDPEPVPTSYSVTRRSAGAVGVRKLRLFADPRQGLLLAQPQGSAAALLAGRLPEPGSMVAPSDGGGNRAAFGVPCAVASGPDGTIYVAEYESSRIRKVVLPEWLREGRARRAGRRPQRWRSDDEY